MEKEDLLPGLPRVQKAIKKASFTVDEFASILSDLGKTASKAGEEWAKEFKNLSLKNNAYGKEK